MPGRVVWIEGAGGTPLCADLYLPAGEGPFAPLLEALPYRKDDVTASYRESYERLVGAGFAVCRARPARHRFVRGSGDRRVPRRRTSRPPGRHRLARRPAVVHRTGRHVRHVVLRVQRVAHGGRRGARARRRGRRLRHRRPLHRRRALLRRGAARHRPDRLRPLHGGDERPAAGPGAVGRRLARRVAAAHRRDPTVAVRVAGRSGRRSDVAPRFDPARPRRCRLRRGSPARRCSSPDGPTGTATTRSAPSST